MNIYCAHALCAHALCAHAHSAPFEFPMLALHCHPSLDPYYFFKYLNFEITRQKSSWSVLSFQRLSLFTLEILSFCQFGFNRLTRQTFRLSSPDCRWKRPKICCWSRFVVVFQPRRQDNTVRPWTRGRVTEQNRQSVDGSTCKLPSILPILSTLRQKSRVRG